jgi:hypothetical protein
MDGVMAIRAFGHQLGKIIFSRVERVEDLMTYLAGHFVPAPGIPEVPILFGMTASAFGRRHGWYFLRVNIPLFRGLCQPRQGRDHEADRDQQKHDHPEPPAGNLLKLNCFGEQRSFPHWAMENC